MEDGIQGLICRVGYCKSTKTENLMQRKLLSKETFLVKLLALN